MPTYTSASQWKPIAFDKTIGGQNIPWNSAKYELRNKCIRFKGGAGILNKQKDTIGEEILEEIWIVAEPNVIDAKLQGTNPSAPYYDPQQPSYDPNWGKRGYGKKRSRARRLQISNVYSEHGDYETDMGDTEVEDFFVHGCGAQAFQFRPEAQTLPSSVGVNNNPVGVCRLKKGLCLNNGRKGGIGRAGYMLTFFFFEENDGSQVMCNRSVEIEDVSVIHDGGQDLDGKGHESLGGIKVLKRPTVLLRDVLIRLKAPMYDGVFVRDAQKFTADGLDSAHNVCLADCRKVEIVNSKGAGLIQLGTMEHTSGGDRWKLLKTVGDLSKGYVGPGV